MFLEGWFQLKPNLGVKTRKIFLSMNENDKNPSFSAVKTKVNRETHSFAGIQA